jgi:hypothetical protein
MNGTKSETWGDTFHDNIVCSRKTHLDMVKSHVHRPSMQRRAFLDKICTALHLYRHIVCPSVSPLSLPLTKSSNLEKNVHVWSWFFPLLCSHSWIISYDLKWYKTNVVFTTVFHRALLSCWWQWHWIVSGVWILAPWLRLRCQLRDVQSSSIDIPS